MAIESVCAGGSGRSLADQVDDRLEVELPRECQADLVDDGQLGRRAGPSRRGGASSPSNRRAFSSATPMLEASVVSSRSSASLNAYCWRLSSAIAPITRSPAVIGTPSHDSLSGPDLTKTAPCAACSSAVCSRSGRRVVMTFDVSPSPELERAAVESLAVLDLVRERDEARRRVVDRDVHVMRPEDGPEPLADQLHDRVEVELLRQGLPDLVDRPRAPRSAGASPRSPGRGSGQWRCAARRTPVAPCRPRCVEHPLDSSGRRPRRRSGRRRPSARPTSPPPGFRADRTSPVSTRPPVPAGPPAAAFRCGGRTR